MRSNTIVVVLTAALLTFALGACSKHEQAAEAPAAKSMPAFAGQAPSESVVAADAAAGANFEEAKREEMAPASPPARVAAFDAVDKVAEVETVTQVDTTQVSSSAATYDDGKRKFVRTANVHFRVKDVYRSTLAVEDAASAQGGFVTNNEISTQTMNVQRRPKGDGLLLELTEYTVYGNVTVRVPSDNTQAFLRAIANQMEFLDRRSFQAADVQLQLLRQQLAAQRSQLQQQELGQVVQSGDRLDRKADVINARASARLNRDEALIQEKEFEDRVEFSTITLSLYQISKIRQTELPDVEAIFQKHSPGFFARLWSSLRVGWYGVLDFVLELIKLWPLWLGAWFALVALRRWRVSRQQTRKTPPPPPPVE
ncbi:MAG: DUF4349 domain-containing protein [Lysobacteraceae bacterium]|nr:MAG: DUF4349 domain-containing protein [Xanthomonadaceae bacterium]